MTEGTQLSHRRFWRRKEGDADRSQIQIREFSERAEEGRIHKSKAGGKNRKTSTIIILTAKETRNSPRTN